MNYDAREIQKHLTGTFGGELVFYKTIDSTNNAAKLLAKNGAPHGAAVIAESQTAGRGRLGRSFHSPGGQGVYLTAILRPTQSASCATILTPAAAVATARAIEKTCGVQVDIKWVNDLYLNGKKLCGILSEAALKPDGMLDYAVVGIGVNILQGELPPELIQKVTALDQAGDEVDRARLAAAILDELAVVSEQLDSRAFLAEYRARSCVLGKRLKVLRSADEWFWAQACDIDDQGALVVRDEQGTMHVLSCGEVSLEGDFNR